MAKSKKSSTSALKDRVKTLPKRPPPKPLKPEKQGPGRPPGKKMGRPKTLSIEEAGDRQRANANAYRKQTSASVRDISEFINFDNINWERRLSCKEDFPLFCKTYLSGIFSLNWSRDQLKCASKIESVAIDGGMFSLAMPRGGGKTALCRGGIQWTTAYGYRKFVFNIGSSGDKALQTLNACKMLWYMSPLLLQDFPEVALAVKKLDNRWHLARGQVYRGEPTHIEWGSESVQYPTLLLSHKDAEGFLKHDPDFLIHIADRDCFIAKSAGTIIRTSGIDGSIRGEAEIHPVLLTQPRPDLVLLDDIQKDQKADSPIACEKLIRLIDGAVQGLAGPGERIAALMPCTVIRDGDVSDTYLDIQKKPEWKGERCRLVESWPPGITDTDISLDTPAGKLWNEYFELRRQSFRLYEDTRLCDDLYKNNREVMDEGFICTWEERYVKKGEGKELSPQQHAMNLRFTAPETFPAEYQNKGRKPLNNGIVPITAAQLMEKTIALPHKMCPADTAHLNAFVDIQDEGLFYTVLATANNFTGCIVDYGCFPEVPSRNFRKSQLSGWSLLTNAFYSAYPNHESRWTNSENRRRAPLEAKIYHGLSLMTLHLLRQSYVRDDGFGTQIQLNHIAFDTRWGEVTDVVKRFCREFTRRKQSLPLPDGSVHEMQMRHDLLIPYMGQHVSPLHKQYEEYSRTVGWTFEDDKNPQVREVKWIYKPDRDGGGQYILFCDVNRMKSFGMQRLASPPGSPGCISLYGLDEYGRDLPPGYHEMFATQVCNSEYPETVIAKLRTKDLWQEREGRPDNEYLDDLVGCLALASFCGAYVSTDPKGIIAPKTYAKQRKLSQLWHEKQQRKLLAERQEELANIPNQNPNIAKNLPRQ